MTKRAEQTPTRHYRATGLAAAALFCANAALASGYSAMPEMRKTFPNHKACVARLNASADEHRKQVKRRTFGADGGFQEISLENLSGGMKVTGRRAARYEARIWYHNGRPLDDGTQYEVSHSWDQSGYECRGKTMIINIARGYTLSTFEPTRQTAPADAM